MTVSNVLSVWLYHSSLPCTCLSHSEFPNAFVLTSACSRYSASYLLYRACTRSRLCMFECYCRTSVFQVKYLTLVLHNTCALSTW